MLAGALALPVAVQAQVPNLGGLLRQVISGGVPALPSLPQPARTPAGEDLSLAANPLFTLTLSTHPPAQQRLDRLETAMASSRFDTLAPAPAVPVAQRLQQQP